MTIINRIASEEYVIDRFDEKFEASADFVITSDGNTSGLFSYNNFYKVSDEVPTMEDFAKGYSFRPAHLPASEPTPECTLNDLRTVDMFWPGSTAIVYGAAFFLVMLQDTTSPDGVTTLTKGVYFMSTTSIAHKLIINPKECIKPELVPDIIARKDDIEEAIEEAFEYHNTYERLYGDIPIGGDTLYGKESVDSSELVNEKWYLASEACPSAEILANGIVVKGVLDGRRELEVRTSTLTTFPSNNGNVLGLREYGVILFIPKDNTTITSGAKGTFEKAGTYFYYELDYTKIYSLKINGYDGFPYTRMIGDKYIPDSVARVDNLSWEQISNKPLGKKFVRGENVIAEQVMNGRVIAELGVEINGKFVQPYGLTYEFVVDGVSHFIRIAESINQMTPIGDIGFFGTANNTGQSQFIETFAEHTIAVYFAEEETIQLPEEYIPETIARTSDIPSLEGIATESYVDTKVANLVNSAPEALNTLDELAAALGDDANFATTVTNQIAGKLGRDELPTAIDSALAQAKESGEFDGATPVRGTDYWTDADKAEIKSYVDEAILGGAW